MIVAKTLEEFIQARESLEHKDSIGFVPTMGALHQGHISLVEHSTAKCKHTIVSIFVNPTQFNNPQDLATYPRTLEADCALLEANGVDIAFAPRVVDIYPEPDTRVFNLGGLDSYGEGPRRPGHFNGVAQVVSRLFEMVQPARAYFGEKDFQQIAVIRAMMRQLGIGLELIPCPIVRGEDGLALSSRNTLLTPEHRAAAPDIYAALRLGAEAVGTKTPAEVVSIIEQAIEKSGLLKVIYVEIVDGDSLESIAEWKSAASGRVQCCVAVQAGAIRLIDNIKLV